MRVLGHCLLIVSAVLAFSQASVAQIPGSLDNVDSGGLDVEAEAGWDSVLDKNSPVPVSFLLSNFSDHVIQGDLYLTDPLTGHEVSLGEVFLSQGAKRNLTTIQNLVDWYDCYAELRDGGDVIWRRNLSLHTGKNYALGVNFALVINDSGRKLRPPKDVPQKAPNLNSGGYGMPRVMMAGEDGRPVQYIQVKTWQCPIHPAPMLNARAVIIPEGTFDGDLNLAQWQALAEWMCQGGIVFAHDDGKKIVEQLLEASPLPADPAVQKGYFGVQRVGLGAIYRYPDDVFKSDDSPAHKEIASAIAKMTDTHVSAIADTGFLHRMRGGKADWNRLWVVVFFAAYAFFSGFISLLLFRQNRRVVGIYTLLVVTGASVSAIVLGGMLRMSEGDLHWITVTEAGAGGMVQIGKLDIQSAGARNTEVAIKGERCNLQFAGRSQTYYDYNRPNAVCPPFTWQANHSTLNEGAYQIGVPMTPWGRRRLHATAFSPGASGLDIRLEFERNQSFQANNAAPGQLTVKITNSMPYDLQAYRLVVAVAPPIPEKTKEEQDRINNLQPWEVQQLPTGTDVYASFEKAMLPAGETQEETFPINFRPTPNVWDRRHTWRTGQLSLPGLGREKTVGAYIVGQLSRSPIISIDEQNTEFEPMEELHLFIQRVRPEDMPDVETFLGLNEQ